MYGNQSSFIGRCPRGCTTREPRAGRIVSPPFHGGRLVAVMSDVDGHPAFLMLNKIVGLIPGLVNNERGSLGFVNRRAEAACGMAQLIVIA